MCTSVKKKEKKKGLHEIISEIAYITFLIKQSINLIMGPLDLTVLKHEMNLVCFSSSLFLIKKIEGAPHV